MLSSFSTCIGSSLDPGRHLCCSETELFTFSSRCLDIWPYISNLTEVLGLFEKKKKKDSMIFYRILKPGRVDVWEQHPHKNTLERLSLLSAAPQPV